MLDHFDELELLDLIEGELDPRAAQQLKQRLASDPRALAYVEQLQFDRKTLRSIEEPQVPMDFLSKIEPLLARPMLMDPAQTLPSGVIIKPDEFRRQHRKRTRRIRWSRLAAVAVVLLALLAGVWATVQGVFFAGPGSDSVALNGNSGGSADALDHGSSLVGTEAPAIALSDGTIHHYRPSPVQLNSNASSMVNAAGKNDPKRNPTAGAVDASAQKSPRKTVLAEFAVVIESTNAAKAEQAVKQSVVSLGDQTAMVRNFSYAEAERLEKEWLLANGRQGDQSVARAALDANAEGKKPGNASAPMQVLADRVRQRLGSAGLPAVPKSGEQAGESSGQIAGAAELAPSLDQQLDFSSRGATYTLAVPATELAKLIESLNMGQGQFTALQMLPARDLQSQPAHPKAQPEPWRPLAMWLTEGPQVRQAIQRLIRADENMVVLIPVIVKLESAKHASAEPAK